MTPLAGDTSSAASAPPSPSPSASPSGVVGPPELAAVPPDTELEASWMEPAWLLVPLVLVVLLAACSLVLLRWLVPPTGRHRKS